MSKLPFVASIFWKVLVVVAGLVVVTFVVFIKFTDYERTTTDTVGATITGIIFSYLVHLWMLPAEQLHPDEEYDDHDEDYHGDEEEQDDQEGRADGKDDTDQPDEDADESP